jgi:hypothetical protein
MPATGAAVATQGHLDCGGSPAKGFVSKATNDRVAGAAFAAAAPVPLVRFHDSAREHRTVRFESLTGDDEAEFVESAERGQVGAGEARRRGSVRHVEVFRMGSVRTSILGRPRPLPGHRRADRRSRLRHMPDYTLNCEEPH